jgi:hypothetical protein
MHEEAGRLYDYYQVFIFIRDFEWQGLWRHCARSVVFENQLNKVTRKDPISSSRLFAVDFRSACLEEVGYAHPAEAAETRSKKLIEPLACVCLFDMKIEATKHTFQSSEFKV